jgi:hypothetical protein
MAQNRTATIGTPCSTTNGDISACQDNLYLECEVTNQVWVRQNECTGNCFEDPIFASNCYKIARTVSSTSTPTPTQSFDKSIPNTPSNPGLSLGAIIGIVISVIFVLACGMLFGYWIFVRRRHSGSKLERKPTHANNVLEKKYIVTLDYQPTASDEVKLAVGDIVVLDLLFNDGWAKVLLID